MNDNKIKVKNNTYLLTPSHFKDNYNYNSKNV